MGTVSFKFCTINLNYLKLTSNTFYCHNIGTIDDTILLSIVMHKEKVYVLFTMQVANILFTIFLVHWLYSRKTTQFSFSLVLVALAGVSKAAPYHLTAVVSEVPQEEQKEHKISYMLSSFDSIPHKEDTSDGLLT